MILHGIEYQRPTSLNMRILADHVTYSFLAFMKSIFHFCLGCYCGGYSQNGRSNLSSFEFIMRDWPVGKGDVTATTVKTFHNIFVSFVFSLDNNDSENISSATALFRLADEIFSETL